MSELQADQIIERLDLVVELLTACVTYGTTASVGIALCWSTMMVRVFLYARNARNII